MLIKCTRAVSLSLFIGMTFSTLACNRNLFPTSGKTEKTANDKGNSNTQQSQDLSWEERLKMTNEENTREHLKYVSETVGDDAFEIQGFYFEGLETILTSVLDDLLDHPERGLQTLEETYVELGFDPRAKIELSEAATAEIISNNSDFLTGPRTVQGTQVDEFSLIQNQNYPNSQNYLCELTNESGWSPGEMKDGKCQSKAASRLDEVAKSDKNKACEQSAIIKKDNAELALLAGQEKEKGTSEYMSSVILQEATAKASFESAQNWANANGCDPGRWGQK